MKLRNQTIDIMRAIGLMLVIAAHCDFSKAFYEFREFDVVLLVYCSGASFMLSSKNEDYFQYAKKRFKRLILPVWIFLVLFLPIHQYILGCSLTIPFIIKTFLLTNGGLMLVWIFRVLFVTALCNPLVKKIKINDGYMLLIGLILIIIDDVFLYFIRNNMSESFVDAYAYIISYTIGYAVISMYGMKIFFMSNKKKMLIAIVSLSIYLALGYFNGFTSLYEAKYPPTLYYVSYGIFWSLLLNVVFEKIKLSDYFGKIIKWLSINSMTIYIWHIVFGYLIADGAVHISNPFIAYLYMLFCSILCTIFQNKIAKLWRNKNGRNNSNTNI